MSYDYFKDFYATIGIKFDKYYPESTVAALGLQTVKDQLEKGVYEMSDGAVIFNGDKFGLHTRVFINKEGVPTKFSVVKDEDGKINLKCHYCEKYTKENNIEFI